MRVLRGNPVVDLDDDVSPRFDLSSVKVVCNRAEDVVVTGTDVWRVRRVGKRGESDARESGLRRFDFVRMRVAPQQTRIPEPVVNEKSDAHDVLQFSSDGPCVDSGVIRGTL